MHVRDGTLKQRAGFAALIALYALAGVITLHSILSHLGDPQFNFATEVGFPYVGPAGRTGAESGLCWGTKLMEVNGVSVAGADLPDFTFAYEPPFKGEIGDVNVLTGLTPGGEVRSFEVPVTTFTWADALAQNGVIYALALVFFGVGLWVFCLRPYQSGSWALLVYAAIFASFLETVFRPYTYGLVGNAFFHFMLAAMLVGPLHLCMTIPVTHPWHIRYPKLIPGLYVATVPLAVALTVSEFRGSPRFFDPLVSSLLLVTMAISLARIGYLAFGREEQLVRQQARVVLAGVAIAFGPPTVLWFVQTTFKVALVDMRLMLVPNIAFPIALAYCLVRHQLFDTKVVIRRSVIYAFAAGCVVAVMMLSLGAVASIMGRTFTSSGWVATVVFGLLLLPVLHFWPRIDARLNAWLYPKRARFPELVREIGNEMALATSREGILRVLASVPARACDAIAASAVLFPSTFGADVAPAAVGTGAPDPRALERTALAQILIATRKEIFRESIAVQPQFANVKDEAAAGMGELKAVVLLPILRDNVVIGALAVGPRDSGDVYEPVELNVLTMLTQQAVQAITRTEAFEQLQAKHEEIALLKRYFPERLVEHVVQKGGLDEFPTQRKLVTVFFSDLRGFTSFSDSVEPEEVMATLADYHRAMIVRIEQFGGTLERFIGDGMMVFFNDPDTQPDHVQRAVKMALAMRNDVRQLRESWVRKGYHLDVGMGIHTGYATVGFVGYKERRDYAVIGNVTNMAARLCDAAGGGEVLVTARVISEMGTTVPYEPVGELTLKGFHQPQLTYRILGAESHV